jgi:hypothetical protein
VAKCGVKDSRCLKYRRPLEHSSCFIPVDDYARLWFQLKGSVFSDAACNICQDRDRFKYVAIRDLAKKRAKNDRLDTAKELFTLYSPTHFVTISTLQEPVCISFWKLFISRQRNPNGPRPCIVGLLIELKTPANIVIAMGSDIPAVLLLSFSHIESIVPNATICSLLSPRMLLIVGQRQCIVLGAPVQLRG